MANSMGSSLPLVTLFLLFPALVLSLPVPSDVGLAPSPSTGEHASVVHHAVAASSASSPTDSSRGPSPMELGIGIGIACFCSVASLLGLYFFWRRPRHEPRPYRKHVPLRSRLRQTFATLLLRTRRLFVRSRREDYSHGPTWLPDSYSARPHRLPSRANSMSRTWRLPTPLPVSKAAAAEPKVVSMIGIAELGSSPVAVGKCIETTETQPVTTFLLPPSPTLVVPYTVLGPAFPFPFPDGPCISRFSATTVDTASLKLPASRNSMVTMGSGISSSTYAHTYARTSLGGQEVCNKKVLRASIATMATTSTVGAALGAPSSSPSSRLQLAAQATLIRTPERAARLVSLRRVRSESVCRVSGKQLQHTTSGAACSEADIEGEMEVDEGDEGETAIEKIGESNEHRDDCKNYDEDKNEHGYSEEETEAEATYRTRQGEGTGQPLPPTPPPPAREGWGRPARWISRSTSLPETRRYMDVQRAPTW